MSNNEIHNGFEQYFTDGPAADLFRQLYDKQEYEIEPWFQAYGSLTAEQRVDSRGDIVRYADESSNYLAIDWLLIFNSIESGNTENLSSELTLAIQNCDKELITNNKYEKIFELWQKCLVINSDFEISEALLFHSLNYFINLSDKNIVENYIEISLNFLSTYFQNNIESDVSNFIFLKLINNKLEVLNENLIKHV